MLDHPEKTARLLAALKAAAPFEVELMPALIHYLQERNVTAVSGIRQTVWDVSYAGDEGGIVCHLSRSDETGQALVVIDPRSGGSRDATCAYCSRVSEASG